MPFTFLCMSFETVTFIYFDALLFGRRKSNLRWLAARVRGCNCRLITNAAEEHGSRVDLLNGTLFWNTLDELAEILVRYNRTFRAQFDRILITVIRAETAGQLKITRKKCRQF